MAGGAGGTDNTAFFGRGGGGVLNPTTAGGDGGSYYSGGGGGAGITGGAGGAGYFGTLGGAGATSNLMAGGAGSSGDSGGGGGGGAHGGLISSSSTVGSVFAGSSGGAGGNGHQGNGYGAGGGGAGGYGAVLSGSGLTVTFNGGAYGASGGSGGIIVFGGGGAYGGSGNGGDGGVGVHAGAGNTFVNNGTISGGTGGAAGGNGANSGVNGAGGSGVTGSNLTITNGGMIAGGLSADGVTRADAITFTGGANTLMILDSSVIIGTSRGGAGVDSLDYSAFSTGVTVDLLAKTATGTDGVVNFENVLGTSKADTITGDGGSNTLNGADGSDHLNGGAGNDTLIGGSGGDQLDGGADTDTMMGGDGNDTYWIDNAGDIADETGGTGIDTVRSRTISVDLADTTHFLGTIEQAAVDGSVYLNVFGNGLDNYLQGNEGSNTLDGREGADTMVGRGGNDTYWFDNAGDIADESIPGSTGIDTVRSRTMSIDLADTAHIKGTIEQAAVDGAVNLNVYGSDRDDYLQGNAGANTLDGRVGADTMVGRGGNDTYWIDNAGDIVDESIFGSNGTDTIRSKVISIDLTDTAHYKGTIEQAAVDGAVNLNITGSDIANYLQGNAGNNVIDGGLDADTLVGRGGADHFRFSTALGGGNIDTITDFTHGTDKIDLDNAIFTSLGPTENVVLGADAYFMGMAAHDGDDRIIYDSATGALFYDSDGTGATIAVQFATLSTGLTVTNTDFLIV